MSGVPATEHYADDRVQLTYRFVAQVLRREGLGSGTGCGTSCRVCGAEARQPGHVCTRSCSVSVFVGYMPPFVCEVPATEQYADDRVQLTYQIVAHFGHGLWN